MLVLSLSLALGLTGAGAWAILVAFGCVWTLATMLAPGLGADEPGPSHHP